MREPANAWSDFSFLAVGLFMLYSGIHNMLWPVDDAIISVVWGDNVGT